MKYWILGFGAVGQSFLTMVINHHEFDAKKYYCVDISDFAKERFIKMGGDPTHFIKMGLNKDNYIDFLKMINEGDYLLDFSTNLKNIDILKYALEHKFHYLCTADSSWEGDTSWKSNHQFFVQYKEFKKKYDKNLPTCVIEFGMNPGLISTFTKQCIYDAVKESKTLYVRLFRKRLLRLLEKQEYAKVAKILKINLIEEVDVDNQKFNINYDKNTVYSPWNVDAFYHEAVAGPEIAYSCLGECLKHPKVLDKDLSDNYVQLPTPGIKMNEPTYYSQGPISTGIISHEEIFSIRDYLTYKNHRPTVAFLYHPSDLASQSVRDNISSTSFNKCLLRKDSVISGGEEVGILIQGKRIDTHYFANFLNTKDFPTTVTVFQVGAGSYAAFKYMQKHPNKGFLFPEELNEHEIMDVVRPILKSFTSIRVNKVKPVNF